MHLLFSMLLLDLSRYSNFKVCGDEFLNFLLFVVICRIVVLYERNAGIDNLFKISFFWLS